MSVYIKGMEMPKICGQCQIKLGIDCELWRHVRSVSLDRHKDCPLVPVPPHGRLIDADALMAKDEKDFSTIMEMTDPETVFGTALADAHTAIQEMLKTAPTVIQKESAEEEKNDE